MERAARPARDDPGRPAGHPRPPAAAQRPRLLRGPRGRPGRAARRRAAADVRDHAPLPRERARAADAHPHARGPGADPAPRPRPSTRRGWSSTSAGRSCPRRPPTAGCARSTGRRWRASPGSSGRDRDLVQAYCDVLEHKWLLSEQAGRDVGLEAAIESYLAEGAPAPERPDGATADADPALDGLDIEDGLPGGPGSPRSTTRGSRAELSPPSARGARARRAARRPPALLGAVRAAGSAG